MKVDTIQDIKLKDRDFKATELVKETKIANFAKLANMLIDLFGIQEAFQKYVKPKYIGKIVEMYFPALDSSIYIALTRDKNNFNARYGKPENSIASIIINVEREKAAILVGKIIRQKSNIFGLLTLVTKLITRKIKIKGSLLAALSLARIMMIGKHPVYKNV
ncbi:MAG: hypothetical protein ACTSR8_07120 [Promethearchaeota archaeon]